MHLRQLDAGLCEAEALAVVKCALELLFMLPRERYAAADGFRVSNLSLEISQPVRICVKRTAGVEVIIQLPLDGDVLGHFITDVDAPKFDLELDQLVEELRAEADIKNGLVLPSFSLKDCSVLLHELTLL